MSMPTSFWEALVGRSTGPLGARFFVQPTIALVMAIRAGVRDARSGRPPYAWTLWTKPAERKELMREGWSDIGRLFIMALAVDAVYQVAVFRWVYPLQTVGVAVVLAFIPYLILRGPVTRLVRWIGPRGVRHGMAT